MRGNSKCPEETENTMTQQTTQRAFKTAIVAVICAASLPSFAGPRVGTVVGTPSSTTSTVDAKVISATPVVAQVATPRQVCYDELRQEPARSSGAGAIVGAIAGAAVGNALGRGSGKALATGVGLIGGAVLGDRTENDGRPGQQRAVQRCEQQSSYENRVVAYSVVYEVGGQRYTTEMDHEPGRTIPVQITVNPSVQSSSNNPVVWREPVQPAVYRSEVVMAPAPVVIETTYERPYRPYYGHPYDGERRDHERHHNGRHWD
jgi:uncharacterized protein YcfJ